MEKDNGWGFLNGIDLDLVLLIEFRGCVAWMN